MLTTILNSMLGSAVGIWIGNFLYHEVYVRSRKVKALEGLEKLAEQLKKLEEYEKEDNKLTKGE